MNNYLILGAGIAGKRAAEAILEKDSKCKITLVEAQSDPFYLRPMLGDLVARNLDVESIASKDPDLTSMPQIDLRTGQSVLASNIVNKTVTLSNREVIAYDKMLIASGRETARRSGGDFVNSTGVVYLDRLSDAQTLADHLKLTRRAVVFGSSFQTIGAIRALRGRGIECTLVLPEERLWPGMLDATASGIVENHLQNEGISVLKGADVIFLERRGDDLQEVLISSGIRIPADLLVMATPQTPLSDYLTNGELATSQGIHVDRMLRTSDDNIFAAGDIAYYPEGSHPSPQVGWLRAWRQGHIAGSNMAGGSAVYDELPSLRTKIQDLNIVSLGESNAEGEDVRIETGNFPFPELPYIYKKLTFRNDRVVGATFIGDVTEAGIVEEWVRKNLKASQCDRRVYDQLFATRFLSSSSAHSALCPVCKYHMPLGSEAQEGTIVTCPACGVDFRMERLSNGGFTAVPVG